jgi:hypothetical protein
MRIGVCIKTRDGHRWMAFVECRVGFTLPLGAFVGHQSTVAAWASLVRAGADVCIFRTESLPVSDSR